MKFPLTLHEACPSVYKASLGIMIGLANTEEVKQNAVMAKIEENCMVALVNEGQ
jgi:hypothetical protein